MRARLNGQPRGDGCGAAQHEAKVISQQNLLLRGAKVGSSTGVSKDNGKKFEYNRAKQRSYKIH